MWEKYLLDATWYNWRKKDPIEAFCHTIVLYKAVDCLYIAIINRHKCQHFEDFTVFVSLESEFCQSWHNRKYYLFTSFYLALFSPISGNLHIICRCQIIWYMQTIKINHNKYHNLIISERGVNSYCSITRKIYGFSEYWISDGIRFRIPYNSNESFKQAEHFKRGVWKLSI